MNQKITRVPLFVTGIITSLLALSALAVGGAALYSEGKKDDAGYLSTKTERFAAPTRALTTDDLDLNFEGLDWAADNAGNLRLKVDSQNGKPVFVGIARTHAVSAYLRGVSRSDLTDIDTDPFRATYHHHGGTHRPAAPAAQRIWAASATGAGRQTVTWKVRSGNWSVVVMNADGSPHVAAGVSAGANLPFLPALAWISVGLGLLLAAGAAALITVATRGQRAASASPAPRAPEEIAPSM